MSTPRIVVTGIGATSPIGGTAPESWSALLAGTSGARTLEHEWVEKYNLPVTFAAEALVRPETVLDRPVAKRLDPSSQLAIVAAKEAWEDAGAPDIDPDRLGVDFATGIGGVWTLLDAWDTLREKGPRRVMPMTVPMLMPNAAAGNLSLHFNARAFARTVASACASSRVQTPPMPVAKSTPSRSGSMSGLPASSQASLAATIASWEEGSRRLATGRSSTVSGRTSASAAKVTGRLYCSTHSCSRERAPEVPASRADQLSGAVPPMGEVAPMPVTTMRGVLMSEESLVRTTGRDRWGPEPPPGGVRTGST